MSELLAHTVNDLANRGLGRTKVYEAIKTGALVARKIGRRTVILDDDLRIYLEALPKMVTPAL